MARIHGCRVVGIAGREEKCAFVRDELGFDACVSHLSESFAEDLAAACPDGVDIYFENVGGKVFEGVLPLLNRHSRITLCGMISQYGNTDRRDGGAGLAREPASHTSTARTSRCTGLRCGTSLTTTRTASSAR